MGKDIYIIDHENVHEYGFVGIEQLKNAKIIIYYSDEVKMTPLRALLTAYAKINDISYVKLTQKGHNALDFMICTRAGYESKVNGGRQIYIVSGDNGYLPAIDSLSMLNQNIKAALIKSIQESLSQKPEDDIETFVSNLQINKNKKKHLLNLAIKYMDNKITFDEFSERITRTFGSKEKNDADYALMEVKAYKERKSV